MTWALVAVIAFLLAERAWGARSVNVERRRLVNALLARNAPEAAMLERAAIKPSPVKRRPVTERDDVDDPENYVLIGTNGI